MILSDGPTARVALREEASKPAATAPTFASSIPVRIRTTAALTAAAGNNAPEAMAAVIFAWCTPARNAAKRRLAPATPPCPALTTRNANAEEPASNWQAKPQAHVQGNVVCAKGARLGTAAARPTPIALPKRAPKANAASPEENALTMTNVAPFAVSTLKASVPVSSARIARPIMG